MKATKGGTGKMAKGQSPRLEGDYPATGPYTSTTYNDEFGRDRVHVQVAVVVRAVRPQEYGSHAEQRAFDKYLPARSPGGAAGAFARAAGAA